MPANWPFWVLFHLFVFAMLALDLGVFHRRPRVLGFREAIAWSLLWIALAAVFAALVYHFGHAMTGSGAPIRCSPLEFVTGYVVEEALSVDNLFVFLLLFRYFNLPAEFGHKVPVLGNPRRAHDPCRIHLQRRRPHQSFSLADVPASAPFSSMPE